MKISVAKLFGIVLAVAGIIAILAGCSSGFKSANNGTKPSPSSQPAGVTAPSTKPVSGGPSSRSNTAYRPRALNASVSGGTVTLPVAEVALNGNGNFSVNNGGTNMSFMAYQLDGKYQVRADLCIPCGSKSFTLQGGNLICDSCGTVFNGTTGAGVRGVSACMSYAKKAVTYTITNDKIVMNMNDLATAYQNTLNRKG